MLLCGAAGTGKSTLLKSWMKTLEPKRYLPLLVTQSSLWATGVLEILLAKLGRAIALQTQHESPGARKTPRRHRPAHPCPHPRRHSELPASLDLLAEASQGNPRILNLLAQAAWLAAARDAATEILPVHIHSALRQVPAANITNS